MSAGEGNGHVLQKAKCPVLVNFASGNGNNERVEADIARLYLIAAVHQKDSRSRNRDALVAVDEGMVFD